MPVAATTALCGRRLWQCGEDSSPKALCYDPANQAVFCANYGGNTVSVISCATNQVIATIPVGDAPVALSYDPQDQLVYCANSYGSSISVLNGMTGMTERKTLMTAGRELQPTIVRRVLMMPRDMTEIRSGTSDRVPRPALLDATGRKVMELQAGPNDVRRLAPGVYFGRQASGVERGASSMTKVILTR